MITAEQNFTISEKFCHSIGWHAMYDRCKDSELSSGVILAYVDPVHEISLFEIAENVNLLDGTEEVSVTPGSCFTDTETGPIPYMAEGFHINRCRFPTKEELDWYNTLDTI